MEVLVICCHWTSTFPDGLDARLDERFLSQQLVQFLPPVKLRLKSAGVNPVHGVKTVIAVLKCVASADQEF